MNDWVNYKHVHNVCSMENSTAALNVLSETGKALEGGSTQSSTAEAVLRAEDGRNCRK